MQLHKPAALKRLLQAQAPAIGKVITGKNSIDKWMWSYFNASPYDDPAAYERVSAITYIKQTKTPTLVVVGERDGEAPPAQSFQFWHALKELHVPTQLFVMQMRDMSLKS